MSGSGRTESGTTSSIATVQVARNGVPSLSNMVILTATVFTMAVRVRVAPPPEYDPGRAGLLGVDRVAHGLAA